MGKTYQIVCDGCSANLSRDHPHYDVNIKYSINGLNKRPTICSECMQHAVIQEIVKGLPFEKYNPNTKRYEEAQ